MPNPIDLIPYFGWPVWFVVIGVVVDVFASPLLKQDVVNFFRESRRPATISYALELFLKGFLYRIFGERIWSIFFLLNSFAISILIVLAIITSQQLSVTGLKFSKELFIYKDPLWLPLVVLLAANSIIDYLTNIITISLVRLAITRCSVTQFIVLILADVTLTITIFTWLFPAPLTLSIIAFQWQHPVATITFIGIVIFAVSEIFRQIAILIIANQLG
jgi:hypothetical protein